MLGHHWPDNNVATGWSIDSRTLQPGDVFFALPGAAHDGGEFVSAAFDKGAAAAVATSGSSNGTSERVLVVPDVLNALGDLARWAVRQWNGDVIGVTGSAGKTSTKDVIASLLSTGIPTGKTAGNFNNHIGLPLSVLRLDAGAKAAVLEYGMNHAGEIRELTTIARPRIAVITNVGSAHLENFDSIEGIALAKRELVDALPENGIAVLNADDLRVAAFAQVHPGRTVTYGLSSDSEVRATDLEFGAKLTRFRLDGVAFETRVPGRHSVRNILAGIAVAGIYGIAPERLVEPVCALEPAKMRGERLSVRGMEIINDCYNSNPDAAIAMLDLLADMPAERRVAVLGEMLELGRWSETLHRGVGIHAAKSGIDVLIGIRGAARFMVDAAMESGLDRSAAFFFEEPRAAGDQLRGMARAGDAILFKGSRGTRVELALERFLA